MSTRGAFFTRVGSSLADIEAQGLTKPERIIVSPQGAEVTVRTPDGREIQALNFCANNYLGLAGDVRLVRAGAAAAEAFGAGLASVRFICGTQSLHTDLERATADWRGAIASPMATWQTWKPSFAPQGPKARAALSSPRTVSFPWMAPSPI